MMIGLPTQIQAALLYLLPVVVMLLWLSERKTFGADSAVGIPAAIALDLLLCLLASRVLPLDVVLIASRVLYLAAGLELVRRRRHRRSLARPDLKRLGILLAAGIAALWLSTSISRPYSIWDRQFHVPLVTMMRGQHVPFLTVFQAHTILHFHFAGDVIAAALQTFSFGRMHASLALALAHDLLFALTGVSVAAGLTAIAARKVWIIPGVLALLMSGPFALQRIGLGSALSGYSYLNLLTLSYRPSISITILLLVGAFGALAHRIARPQAAPRDALVALLACVAVLAISDEPSAGLLGLGIGAVWLIYPPVLHPSRKVGIAILFALAAAVAVPNLLFQAALVPGGPVQKLSLVALRSPGFADPPLSLQTSTGREALLLDLAPFLLVMAALVGTSFQERTRRNCYMAVGLGVVLLAATLALTAVDMNGMNIENHRFMTICMVMFPLAGLVLLAQLPAGRWERIPVIGALLISAISTFYWARTGIGSPDDWFTNTVDCRTSAGARLFEAPRPTYVPRSVLYPFAGCRAVFVPGGANANNWSGVLLNGYAVGGKEALAILHRDFVGPSEALQVACPVDGWQADPVCASLNPTGRCVAAGAQFVTCDLSPDDRVHLLAKTW